MRNAVDNDYAFTDASLSYWVRSQRYLNVSIEN